MGVTTHANLTYAEIADGFRYWWGMRSNQVNSGVIREIIRNYIKALRGYQNETK